MVMVLVKGLIRPFCFAQDFDIVRFSNSNRIRVNLNKVTIKNTVRKRRSSNRNGKRVLIAASAKLSMAILRDPKVVL